MSIEGRDAREVQAHLAARGVVAPAGSFYAHEPFTALKPEDPAPRAGLAPYNTSDDVDRFLDGLADFSERATASTQARPVLPLKPLRTHCRSARSLPGTLPGTRVESDRFRR
ncbi:hypothetical protein ACH4F6_31090 [Streptomyces sp. NPDC017936]|uniref:hypothetical protein n=1 Tax=Streptomyces sp. NPDC017936 TaxID=3365016 RepID=UPI00378880C7